VCNFVFCLFVILFLCTVTDFSAVEKARGMKFCMRVRLLSGQVFPPFGEHWLVGNHRGGCISTVLTSLDIGLGPLK